MHNKCKHDNHIFVPCKIAFCFNAKECSGCNMLYHELDESRNVPLIKTRFCEAGKLILGCAYMI